MIKKNHKIVIKNAEIILNGEFNEKREKLMKIICESGISFVIFQYYFEYLSQNSFGIESFLSLNLEIYESKFTEISIHRFKSFYSLKFIGPNQSKNPLKTFQRLKITVLIHRSNLSLFHRNRP